MTREFAFLAAGVVAGMLIAMALGLEYLQDRALAEEARLAATIRSERARRCAMGQHREVAVVKTAFLYLKCCDCSWTEELGVAYTLGSNRRSRRAS